MNMRRAAILMLVLVSAGASSNIDFQRDVRPILASNCFQCHGPDTGTRQAGLRLDTREGLFVDRKTGPVVLAGKPEASRLYQRISEPKPALRMPPPQAHKNLTATQIGILRAWIEQGAVWEQHWAFAAPLRPALPDVRDASWVRNPIDRFLLARLEAEGLGPAPEADRRALARRVSLDLTGLPPRPDEVDAFVRDQSPAAYEKLVDRHLGSPRWGEHRARYWLDAARYADTHGLHADNYREMWPYRDWVIDAFNRNMPFDQFTLEQIAGDLLPGASPSQIVATGFHRCNVTTSEAGVIPAEAQAMYTKDRVETTSMVWLGLTLGCAACHDHKFDPVTQRDFYRFAAFFNNTTQKPLDGNIPDPEPLIVTPRAEDRARWAELQILERELKRRLTAGEYSSAEPAPLPNHHREGEVLRRGKPFTFAAEVKAVEEPETLIASGQGWRFLLRAMFPVAELNNLTVAGNARLSPGSKHHVAFTWQGSVDETAVTIYVDGDPVAIAPAQRPAMQAKPLSKDDIKAAHSFDRALRTDEIRLLAKPGKDPYPATRALLEEIDAVGREQRAIRWRGGATLVMEERAGTQPTAQILFRGQYDQPKETVTPAVPSVLPPIAAGQPANRLGLAQWLIDPANPLTARVAVNRFWQEVFGTGIVRTSEDFGATGEAPSHPELLDWLAVEFRESGWDVKRLFRLIVTSAAYRQAAAASPEKLERDPGNRLLSRGPRFRMDAEMVRDLALAASGLLVEKTGGPSVRPYQPPGVWEAVAVLYSNTRFYVPDEGENLYRRSLYTFWKRSAPPASMEIFNAPSRETCTVRRERTNTPLQALVTLNDPQFVQAARTLAEHAVRDTARSFDARIDFLALRVLSRRLAKDERQALEPSYAKIAGFYRTHPVEAARLAHHSEEAAVWTAIASQILNLDEALNK